MASRYKIIGYEPFGDSNQPMYLNEIQGETVEYVDLSNSLHSQPSSLGYYGGSTGSNAPGYTYQGTAIPSRPFNIPSIGFTQPSPFDLSAPLYPVQPSYRNEYSSRDQSDDADSAVCLVSRDAKLNGKQMRHDDESESDEGSNLNGHDHDADKDESQDRMKKIMGKSTGVARKIKQMVLGHRFQAMVGVLIFINVIVMAAEADTRDFWLWPYVENFFLICFTSEICLRLFTYKCCGGTGFFTDPVDRLWNWFDFIIIMIGALDLWVLQRVQLTNISGEENRGMSRFVTILRVVRILRILRLLRLFKAFKQLYLLATGLIYSLKGVFWISMMFMMIILVSAIFCTNIIGHEAESYTEKEKIKRYFGTVPRSMVTLFQFVTLDDWSSVAFSVTQDNPMLYIFFILYIMLTAFTVISLLTGVVAEHMLEVTKEDDMAEEGEKQTRWFEMVEKIGDMFSMGDIDDDGMISREEFSKVMHSKKFRQELSSLGVEFHSTDHVMELFDFIDIDNTGQLTKEQFRDAFLKIRGHAKAKDIMKVDSEVIRLQRLVTTLLAEHPKVGQIALDDKAHLSLDQERRSHLNDKMDAMAKWSIGTTKKIDSLSESMTQMEDNWRYFMEFMGCGGKFAEFNENRSQSDGENNTRRRDSARSIPSKNFYSHAAPRRHRSRGFVQDDKDGIWSNLTPRRESRETLSRQNKTSNSIYE